MRIALDATAGTIQLAFCNIKIRYFLTKKPKSIHQHSYLFGKTLFVFLDETRVDCNFICTTYWYNVYISILTTLQERRKTFYWFENKNTHTKKKNTFNDFDDTILNQKKPKTSIKFS